MLLIAIFTALHTIWWLGVAGVKSKLDLIRYLHKLAMYYFKVKKRSTSSLSLHRRQTKRRLDLNCKTSRGRGQKNDD